MTDEEDKPLHSSDSEFLHPKKLQKHNCLQSQSDLISLQPGPPKHGQGLTNSSVEKICKRQSSNFNSHLFRSPSENSLTDQGSVIEPNKLPKNIPVYENNNNSFTSEARLEISPNQESFIQELAKLNTSANRHAAVVYLSMHSSHKMDLLGESISKLQGIYTSGGKLSQRDKMIGAHTFMDQAAKGYNDLIQVLLHQFFISPEVESYTKGTDSGSIVIGKSLFSMTMKKLNNKPNEWRKKYLPIPFGEEDNEAQLIVATEVRCILKQERNLFKKKIMKNIIVHEGNPEQPIPRLIELAKLLFEWAAPKGKSYSSKEIKEKFKDSKLRQRFALLQVCATYQQFHNREAPWREVDEKLENLKKHSTTFRNAFYNIIFKLDNYISKKKVSDIDWEKIYPPTDLDVEEEINRLENNSFSIINDNSGEE
ncbi:hypothetical protein BY996DRAFT_8685976 [Phakopsora pachyrhizi]|nr:hypothetical protein BY996DRAFT_8685976 [Phakopsora pachyrhizi]